VRKHMKSAAVLAVLAIIGLILVGVGPAPAKKPHVVKPAGCGVFVTSSQFSGFSKRVWDLDRWRRDHGEPKRAAIRAAVHMRHCALGAGHQDQMRIIWLQDKQAYYRYRGKRMAELRALIALTPYDCGSMGRFAIPCDIVSCESGGSWGAANPSGAIGPYQFLGWAVPWPVRTKADQMAHHRQAAYLWADSPSHWAQCL
jgi:hypothetical protein